MINGKGGVAVGVVSIALVTAYGCTRSPVPGGDSSLGEGHKPFVRPTPPVPYTAPKLRASSCGDAPATDLGPHGDRCPPCEAGAHCRISYVRGEPRGACVKSQCAKDADCPGALCVCGPPNLCVPGDCRGPEDCGGRECALGGKWGSGLGSFCRSEADTCATDEHCGKGMECRHEGKRFTCVKELPPPPAG